MRPVLDVEGLRREDAQSLLAPALTVPFGHLVAPGEHEDQRIPTLELLGLRTVLVRSGSA